jgi:hypothetical protein
MQNWNSEVRDAAVNGVLRVQKTVDGERCFISAYQIAVLVHRNDPSLKEDGLPIGGKGKGTDKNDSFAKQIAWHLSKDINNNTLNNVERRFFSINGLSKFAFTGDNGNECVPSDNEFTMFRLKV